MTLRIAVTPGEPAGIGPDLILQLAQQDWPAELVVIADKNLLKQRAKLLGIDIQLIEYQPNIHEYRLHSIHFSLRSFY